MSSPEVFRPFRYEITIDVFDAAVEDEIGQKVTNLSHQLWSLNNAQGKGCCSCTISKERVPSAPPRVEVKLATDPEALIAEILRSVKVELAARDDVFWGQIEQRIKQQAQPSSPPL